MRKSSLPYCPYNGCGMANGAAPSVKVIHKCGHNGWRHDTYCKECFICNDCGRIIKRKYNIKI